jgi:Mrp family chromosome partitioning ATPase
VKAVGVFSTKGGTGKTTVALNLTHRLSKHGRTALLDADIDNANFAQFTKLKASIDITPEKTIVLPELNGVKVFSMSLVNNKGVSMTADRYVQIINDVIQYGDWGEIDYAVIDLPPGSSNMWRAVLKIFAEVLIGDVIVIQPGLYDSIYKAIDLHKYYDIPVLALVENMSYFDCKCGERHLLFGEPLAEDKVRGYRLLRLPFRPRNVENVIFEHEVFDELAKLVLEAEVRKTSFLDRIREAVSDELKQAVIKVVAYVITKAQKEYDPKYLRGLAEKYGFTEQKTFALTIMDNKMENVITRVVLRFKDGKLVVVTKPEQIDYEIAASYRALARAIMGKAKVDGRLVDFDPVDAWLKGEVVAYGMGSVARAFAVIKVLLQEEEFIKDVRSRFGWVLERWI